MALPNDENRHKPATNFGADVRGIPGNSLEAAIAFVSGNARTTGEEPFGLRQKATTIQRESLVQWAEKSGLMIQASMWEGKTTIGGSEHDIWEMDGEYWNRG